jgi:hypothetical protein
MNCSTEQLRTLIEEAMADGVGMDDVEHELLAPAHLPPDLHDAMWLYAFARSERPHGRDVPVVAGG